MTPIEVAQHVVRIKHGETMVVQTEPGIGTVHTLKQMLPEHGLDWAELWASPTMCEAQFVETLNDIRLRDQVLILGGLDGCERTTEERVRDNLQQCFSKFGGRTIVVKVI